MNADEKLYRNPKNFLLMRTNSYDTYPLHQPYVSLVALREHVFFYVTRFYVIIYFFSLSCEGVDETFVIWLFHFGTF